MFWADKLVEEIKIKYKDKIDSKKPLIIRDEKTASGRIPVGSLRGVAIHGIISEVLSEQKINNTYLYEINDFDPMDGMPIYVDEEKFLPYMGKPLYTIPSPDDSPRFAGEAGKAENYAEYFAEEFIGVIKELGFSPKFYRASDLYKSGKYNEVIKIVLENADKIREIYKRISGSIKEKDWFPLQVVCEKCGKIGTTKVISFDGEKVEYVCEENLVDWAKGCGNSGKISPFNGNAKLPWKVEWAAKFVILGVDIEGAGKDLSTKGGARETSDAICREVFNQEPPFHIPYEHFQVAGKKMSTSKGVGSSSKEISDLLPVELLRFLLLKEPRRVIDFIPDGDTVPILYDEYDRIAEHYFSEAGDDYSRIFALAHKPEDRMKIQKRFLPRFSQVAFLAQMPHMDINNEMMKIKGSELTSGDRKEISYRSQYALQWISLYAPEDYKYELQEKEVPESARNFTKIQKEALSRLLEYIKSQESLDGQLLHTKIHDIKKEVNIEPREFFSAIYRSFLDRESGPQAGWFLSVLDKEFLEKRLEEVVK